MNVELLREIQQKILSEPERFTMDTWVGRTYTPGKSECGTTACIAGWALSLSTREPLNLLWYRTCVRKDAISRDARQALGLTNEQAEELFYSYKWPEPFRYSYHPVFARTFAERAAVASAYIDHFIAKYSEPEILPPPQEKVEEEKKELVLA